MAKPKAAPKEVKATGKKIERRRRNALERKCLPKSFKRLFRDAPKSTMKALLAAWQEGRKKVKDTN